VHSAVDRPLETQLPLSRPEPPPQNLQQEAQLEEKRSLDSLKTFLAHACEVLGLWKVLSDHQFHCLADGLSQVSAPESLKVSLIVSRVVAFLEEKTRSFI